MEEETLETKSMENDPELKRLRTYEDDVKNAINDGGISTTKIVMAEQAKREQQVAASAATMNARPQSSGAGVNYKSNVTVLISVLLLGLGAALIYFNYGNLKLFLSNRGNINNENHLRRSVSDITINIDSIGKTKDAIIREIQEIIAGRNVGNINEIIELTIIKDVPVETERGVLTQKEKINASDFFGLIDSRAPDVLIRSFKNEFVMGFHRLEKLEPFIILKSEDTAQTYSGMLNWENNMGRDVSRIFFENLIPRETVTVGDDSENDSPNKSSVSFNINRFEDRIIMNKDARAITNQAGQILFFYSIIDNENVILTTNRDTFVLLLDRINQVNLIR